MGCFSLAILVALMSVCLAAKTAGGKSAAGVKFNPMDKVRDTVTQVLNDTANHEILVLNVPMDSFTSFISDLQALLTLI